MESQPVMDLSAALDRFDGDRELFLTLAGMFVERAAETLATIHAALATQDLPLLAKEAHKLKGSALEFCAHPAVTAAAQLEASARQAAAQDVAALGERVHAETQRLTTELKGIIEKGFPS
ncbi:MAG: Hpt domain-containing protein [Nitrospira defluvii]|nr:Hpt domain-containing protein [Nitrospira defluvii]